MWSCVVTTAPRKVPTLERTLRSLKNAGWENPIVVNDKDRNLVANWITAVELSLKGNPKYCLIVQDDVVFDANLRNYVEKTVTEFDVCSLFTWRTPKNKEQKGWIKGPVDQGALAYILTPNTGELVLDYFTKLDLRKKSHPKDDIFLFYPGIFLPQTNYWPQRLDQIYGLGKNYLANQDWKIVRKNRNLDVHVEKFAIRFNLRTLIHNPNLCQHIGVKSSIGNVYSPRRNAEAFRVIPLL